MPFYSIYDVIIELKLSKNGVIFKTCDYDFFSFVNGHKQLQKSKLRTLKCILSCSQRLEYYNPVTLKDPFISESCIEIKIELNFYFHTSLWCLKRFYEGLKGLNFFTLYRNGTLRVKRVNKSLKPFHDQIS